MATKLYVGNLSYDTTEDQLREKFTELGEVESVSLITDRQTGRSRGFAFVEMTNEEDAKNAVENLTGQMLDGRALNVSVAKPKEDRRSFGEKSYGNRPKRY